MYEGWIVLPPSPLGGQIVVECELFLKVKHPNGSYDVSLPDEGLEKLDKYWGEAIWGLEHAEESK